ncbi:1-aminocyclopropane-1-carboxylate oxidase homolog 1-like protein [Tanacetum coccineum]
MDISNSKDDRTKQLKAFDDTKSGVKGLLDAAAGGVVDIPQIFIRPPEEVTEDLELTRTTLRVVNHGVPIKVLEAMLNGAREFYEQDVEVKKEYYSRDPERMVKFNTNYDFYMSKSATWRDTLIIDMLNSNHLDPQDLPSPCRNATVDYLNQVMELADTLFELLSEALGLEPNHLKHLQKGSAKDSNLDDFTEDNLIDTNPMQIVSNDKFKSVTHRALGNVTRARTSVAYFLHGVVTPPKMYGPVERIITKESPRLFREFTVKDYMMKFYSRGLDEKSGLNYVRI